MNAILKRGAFALVMACVVVGCTKDEPESDVKPPAPPPATSLAPAPVPAPTPEPTTNLVPENPSGTGPQARVKSEVDGKDPDPGDRGPALAAGKVSFTAPQGWTAGKSGVWSTATATDNKAAVAAGALAAGESSISKLSEAAGALGYTDCQWGTSESLAAGKERIPATAADGTCKQNGAVVKTAYVAFDSLNALALGGWAEGGDANAFFSTFRSAKKLGGGGDSTGIAACCAALAQNANSAPPEQKGAYIAAAAACRAVINNPQGRAALATARAMLAGANVPSSCR